MIIHWYKGYIRIVAAETLRLVSHKKILAYWFFAYEEHGVVFLGVVERDISADEIGETFVDDRFDSLWASRSILR